MFHFRAYFSSLTRIKATGEEGRGGGVERVLNKYLYVYTGRLRPEIQLLTLLQTIFYVKGTPFVYLVLTNGISFTDGLAHATGVHG